MRYYLAIDKGQAKRADNEDRFVRIDLSSNVKNGYFTSLVKAVDFTSKYESYSELFLDLLNQGLIDKSLVGEPFCICYQGKESGEVLWKNCGTKRHIKENKIIFKKDAWLFEPVSDQELKNAYYRKNAERYTPIDDRSTIDINFTDELLSQELFIPRVFDYEQAEQSEKDKFDFLVAFTKEIGFIVNDLKRSGIYSSSDNYARYVNTIDSFNGDLKKYLYDSQNFGHVNPRFFVKPIKVITQLLCTKSDDRHETYKMNNSQLYELITFYLSFYDKKKNTMKNELIKISNALQRKQAVQTSIWDMPEFSDNQEYVQVDIWGNVTPYENVTRRRKK